MLAKCFVPILVNISTFLHGCYGRKYSLLTMFLRFSPQYCTVLSRVYHIEAKLYLVREEGKELHTLSSCKRNIVETLKLVYCMSMYSRKGCICLYFKGGATTVSVHIYSLGRFHRYSFVHGVNISQGKGRCWWRGLILFISYIQCVGGLATLSNIFHNTATRDPIMGLNTRVWCM